MPTKAKPAKPSRQRRSVPKPKFEAVLRARTLDLPHMVHGFSTRLKPGSSAATHVDAGAAGVANPSSTGLRSADFNLGFVDGFSREAVERNRAAFIRAIDGSSKRQWTLVQMKQIHSDIIHVLRAAPEHALNGDGLVTNV